jgi:hypothetical protein
MKLVSWNLLSKCLGCECFRNDGNTCKSMGNFVVRTLIWHLTVVIALSTVPPPDLPCLLGGGGGLCCWVVKVSDLQSLASHHCRLESRIVRILSCEEAIQLAYGRSVVLLGCALVPEIMHGGAPGVFLHHESWKVAIWPSLCWCDVKPNKINKWFSALLIFGRVMGPWLSVFESNSLVLY